MKKFNLRNSAAIVIYTMLVSVLLSSCNYKKEDCKHKLVATTHNGSGWNKSWHSIECDSINMITIKKAEVFIDGTKMIIEADNRITVHSNCH